MSALVFHIYMAAATLTGIARSIIWISTDGLPKDPALGIVAMVALQIMLLAFAWFTARTIQLAKDPQ